LKNFITAVSSAALFFLFFLGGCKNADTATGVQNIDWSKETNFKLNFDDEYANIKNIKVNKSLMNYVLDAVEKGELKAYNFQSMKMLTKTQVDSIFYPKEKVVVYDENGFEVGEKEMKNELNRPAVNKFRVKQEWYFANANKKLESKVKGVAPMETIFNEDNTVRGDLPLFWVLFE